MKSLLRISYIMLAGFFLLAFSSCLKDTTNRTYTIYTPVYKSKAEVRAGIVSGSSQAIVNAGKIYTYGNYIFLNEIDKGVHIIDNSNPASPVNKYFIAIPGNIDLAVKDNILYADLYSDMVTIDIADPTQIQLKKLTTDVFPFRQYDNGFSPDTSMIIVDWLKKDTTVSEGFVPHDNNSRIFMPGVFEAGFLGNATTASVGNVGTGGSMARFCVLNDYLYTVTNNALNVFNVSTASNPVFTNKAIIGGGIETIYPFKGNLFIGANSGMSIYSISNPQQPVRLGAFAHANACDPVIADDNYAYVTLRSGTACQTFTNQLDVVNISQVTQPQLAKTYSLTNPHGLAKKGSYLYICDGKDGLKVFNAANPLAITLTQHVKGLETYDAIALSNVLLVVCKNGLYQYNYGANGAVEMLSKLVYQ